MFDIILNLQIENIYKGSIFKLSVILYKFETYLDELEISIRANSLLAQRLFFTVARISIEMIRRLFSTSLSLRVDPASLKGFNMMTKMLRKQQKAIELHKQRQQNNQKPPPPKSKPNKLKFQDTEKTRNFNSLFHENILLVLHNQTFHQYFKNSGLTITKVSS